MPFKLKDISFFGLGHQSSVNNQKQGNQTPDKKKRASYSIKQQPIRNVRYEISDIDAAKNLVLNPDRPDRNRLYGIYRYIMADAHLSSQVSLAIMKVQSKAFGLYSNKSINKDATALIMRPWFIALVQYILETEFWSHSLVELIVDLENQSAEACLIPREYVSPEYKQVLIEGTLDGQVLPYADVASKINLVEFQSPDKLGLLAKAAPNVIFKYYARSDWSRASEKFGMPILHLKVNTSDDKELDEAERRAASFGSDGYIVTQDGDEATVIERKNDKMHENYLENIKYCDEQNSKLINGQTASSDTKSFTGAAQVQERVLDDYTSARMRMVKNEINFKVIPYLIEKGFTWLGGLEFDFDEFRNPPVQKATEPTDPAQKKNLAASLFRLD